MSRGGLMVSRVNAQCAPHEIDEAVVAVQAA
jgi:hypothetical protein